MLVIAGSSSLSVSVRRLCVALWYHSLTFSCSMMWGLRLRSWEFAVWSCACHWRSYVINVYKPVTYHTRLHATKQLNVRLWYHSPTHSRDDEPETDREGEPAMTVPLLSKAQILPIMYNNLKIGSRSHTDFRLVPKSVTLIEWRTDPLYICEMSFLSVHYTHMATVLNRMGSNRIYFRESSSTSLCHVRHLLSVHRQFDWDARHDKTSFRSAHVLFRLITAAHVYAQKVIIFCACSSFFSNAIFGGHRKTERKLKLCHMFVSRIWNLMFVGPKNGLYVRMVLRLHRKYLRNKTDVHEHTEKI